MRLGLGGNLIVTATERWLAEIRAGRGFMKGASASAAAGQNPEVQLFNPVASGVTVILRMVLASNSVAVDCSFRQFNTALATLAGEGINLLSGAAAGKGEVRTATPAAIDGTLIGFIDIPASQTIQIAPEWMFELGAGEGLHVAGPLAASLRGLFLWNEV